MKNTEKKPSALLRVLQVAFKHYPIHIIISILGIIAGAFSNVRGTAFMRVLIDEYIIPLIGQSSPDFGPLSRAILEVALFYLLGAAGMYLSTRVMVYVSQGSILKIRMQLFSHMQKLPIRYFDTHAHGDTMSIYTNDVDTLREVLGAALPQLFNAVVTLVSISVTMLFLSPLLTLIAFVLVFITLTVGKNLAGMSGKYFVKQQKSLGKLNGYIEEMISGQKVVKVFCHEEEAIKDFDRLNDELRDHAYRANSFANILMPVIAQLGNVNYVIIAILGGIFAINNMFGISIGVIVSFLSLVKNLNHPFGTFSQQINAVVKATAGAGRIYDLIDAQAEEDEGYVSLVNVTEKDGVLTETKERTGRWAWKHYHQSDNAITLTPLLGDIILENVDFGYVPEKMVLHDVSLYAHKGQKVAFVGSTGAGKTTITNLINRFYDIQSGKIRYDGINIDKIRKSDLRRSLGVVLQDTHLFTGTIMENIRYGRADATDEECIRAAKLANADSFIEKLAQGYDTVISADGGKLSQGQRQLLAIARAAVADPPVLILDEATSSIDTRTEQLVQNGMDALMGGRTTFVIAHRLSTVKNADCIMVLEQGRIVERGSHEELLRQKGRYYQLYTGGMQQSA